MKYLKQLNMKKLHLAMLLAPLIALGGLSGCTPTDKPATQDARAADYGFPDSQAVTASAIRQHGRGFSVGQQMSMNEVFVFFDPKCPHCALFWDQTASMRQGVKFTWLPVAFMGPDSSIAGAALMNAEDKTKAMNAHAADVLLAMRTRTRMPTSEAKIGDAKFTADIARNTKLLTSFGADSVPYIVAVNGNGKVLLNKTGVSPAQVAAAFAAAAP